MHLSGDAKLLRVFTGETHKAGLVPVYERIVTEARKHGMAGATAYRGIMGFGKSSRIHSSKILHLSDDMPVIVELVDDADKIDGFMPVLDRLLEETDCGGLVTVERVDVKKYLGRNAE